jgi:diguanylate cyclase (GGDEF)-like protein
MWKQLMGILTSQDQRYLSDGYIVTDNGRYIGLGTGDQLVRAVTETRIEAARHANPLTFLPGNIPISLHMQRLLDNGTEFVACYADLNHFKPFNDHYGYWRGDQMIRLVARLATMHCDARRDFVGHVGGDDFMLIFQSDDWLLRCQAIADAFAHEARLLYDESARQGRRHPRRRPARRAAVLPVHHPVGGCGTDSRRGAFATPRKWPTWPPRQARSQAVASRRPAPAPCTAPPGFAAAPAATGPTPAAVANRARWASSTSR